MRLLVLVSTLLPTYSKFSKCECKLRVSISSFFYCYHSAKYLMTNIKLHNTIIYDCRYANINTFL